MSQKIRIKLKSYDHKLVDKSAEKIVKAVKATGAIISGPIPLPTHKRIYTVNRSTFVNKKAREQFQLSDYSFPVFDALIWDRAQMSACVFFQMYFFLHTFAPCNYKSHVQGTF